MHFSDPMTGHKKSRNIAARKPAKGEEARKEEDGDEEDGDEEDEEEEDEDEENDEEDEEGEDEVEDCDDPDPAKLFDEVSLLDSNLTYSHFCFLSGCCHCKCP